MTANRWWVRLGARWLARVDGVSSHLRLAMLALTGVSTMSVALQGFGLGHLAAPLAGGVALAMPVYAYLYAEGGVWNQTARDKTDLSTNYSGPTMLMDAKIEARQLAYLGYALQNGDHHELEELITDMDDLTEREWHRLRDGVDETHLEAEA